MTRSRPCKRLPERIPATEALTLVQKRLMGVTYLDRITIAAGSAEAVGQVVSSITAQLRVRRRTVSSRSERHGNRR